MYLRNLFTITAYRYERNSSAKFDGLCEKIWVENKMSVMRGSKYLVQIRLELIFVGIHISLEICFDRSKLAKDIM